MKGIDSAAREFVEIFETRRLNYVLMGGLAVRMHAIPRPTYDVDFTLAISRDRLEEIYTIAEQKGYTVPAAQRTGWLDQVRGLPVVKLQHFVGDRAIDVDIFLAETPYQHELLKRRQRHTAEGFEAWFVTPEDLILLKLLADRPKDRIDIADILFIQGELDKSYMRQWADQLGIRERLEAALVREG